MKKTLPLLISLLCCLSCKVDPLPLIVPLTSRSVGEYETHVIPNFQANLTIQPTGKFELTWTNVACEVDESGKAPVYFGLEEGIWTQEGEQLHFKVTKVSGDSHGEGHIRGTYKFGANDSLEPLNGSGQYGWTKVENRPNQNKATRPTRE